MSLANTTARSARSAAASRARPVASRALPRSVSRNSSLPSGANTMASAAPMITPSSRPVTNPPPLRSRRILLLLRLMRVAPTVAAHDDAAQTLRQIGNQLRSAQERRRHGPLSRGGGLGKAASDLLERVDDARQLRERRVHGTQDAADVRQRLTDGSREPVDMHQALVDRSVDALQRAPDARKQQQRRDADDEDAQNDAAIEKVCRIHGSPSSSEDVSAQGIRVTPRGGAHLPRHARLLARPYLSHDF